MLLATSLVMLPGAGTVAAQGPSLVGEVLSAFEDVQIEATCNPDGISTLSFDVSGTAVGPYPGTFEAKGP